MTLYRIATVKATGKKYLVSFIDFRANKVVCWGEVTKRKGLRTWHGPNKAWMLEAVEIGPERPKDEAFVRELVDQMIAGLREEGHVVDVRVSPRGNMRYGIVPKKF